MFLISEFFYAFVFVNSFSIFLNCDASDPSSDNYYYSNNVTEATTKFVAACNYANGSVEYLNHTERGANGEMLQATVCSVGDPTKRAVVYTISGTHGVEGYAGSMAQISMLRGNSSMYPPGVRMVHLHMVNPYGASHILKENEQNADQLKNQAMYYALNYDYPILQTLMDEINLSSLGNQSARDHAYAVFGQLIAQYGEQAVNLALKTGQGKRPQGIAYFGPSKSWSSQMEDHVVNKYLPTATDILLIDWHTAVGPYGAWSFMPVDEDSAAAFKRWVPNGLTTEYDLGVPTGGQSPYSNVKALTRANRVIRGLWEAGTYNATMTTDGMLLLRLYCRFYSDTNDPFCAGIISQTKEYFYPQSDEWKVLTFNGINNVLPKVLHGFAAEISFGIQLVNSQFYVALACTIALLWHRI